MQKVKESLETLGFTGIRINYAGRVIKFRKGSFNHSEIKALSFVADENLKSIKDFEIKRSGTGLTCIFQFHMF